jgi:hypothetical protein
MSDAMRIDALEIQIQSSSQSAVNGVNALTGSLTKLRDSLKGGIGLDSVIGELKRLDEATRSLDGSASSKIRNLSGAIKTLSDVSKNRISSSLGNQLRSISDGLRNFKGGDYSYLNEISKSMASLSQIKGGTGLKNVMNQLKELPTLATSLSAMDIKGLIANLKELSGVFVPLGVSIQRIQGHISNLPSKFSKMAYTSSKVTEANNGLKASLIGVYAKARMVWVGFSQLRDKLSSFITESNKYIEDLNLFTASMGDGSKSAQEFGEKVSDAMGIDPAEWLRNQGIFNTITEGFGVASDRAHIMSKNLTQLGYDLSSFFNISYEDSMQKLQSGLAGELEPLRRLGFDLSVARLQQEAYNLGINQSVNSMTQAEKAQLRYHAILTQVTVAQGDMARTIDAPANQLRIFKAQLTQAARAIGNMFIPMLQAILPYAIAVAKVITLMANVLARLFGYKKVDIDYSSVKKGSSALGGMTKNANNAGRALGGATKKAKELKNALLGIDELHIISPLEQGSGGAGGGGAGGVGGIDGLGSGMDFDLDSYDFTLGKIVPKFEKIFQKMKKWLGLDKEINSWSELMDTRFGHILETVTAIGVAFGTWKISKSLISSIKNIEKLGGVFNGLKLVGAILFVQDILEFIEAIHRIAKEGANFSTVGKAISEFAGMLGDSFIILGKTKLGGALKVVQGIGEIVTALRHISKKGINFDDIQDVIHGIGNIGIAIGLMTGNWKTLGIGMIIQGISGTIDELRKAMSKLKKGDWSGFRSPKLIISAIEMLAGIGLTFGWFSKLKFPFKKADVLEKTKTITEATETVSPVKSGMTGKLKNLAKDMGLGLVIMTEVIAAVSLFVGGIALVGYELGLVGKAWSPVIENKEEILKGMTLGTLTLIAVGGVTYVLGQAGKTIAPQMGLGIAVLVEIGVATAIFLGEIILVAKLLDRVGKAWQPVLDNGDTIKQGIKYGTLLLVGIGVVTAGLGLITVGTAGTIPMAIAIGTALLLELAGALVLFVNSLVRVANSLSERLAPALGRLNDKLPKLKDDMYDFGRFMGDFAKAVWDYTKNSAIAGLGATIDKVLDFFLADPIERLSDDVHKISVQASSLRRELKKAVPKLEECKELMVSYKGALRELKKVLGKNGGNYNLSDNLGVTVTVRVNLVKNGWSTISSFIGDIPTLSQRIRLKRKDWRTVKEWVGDIPTLSQAIQLVKKGWTTVASWVGAGGSVTVGVYLRLARGQSLENLIGTSITVDVSLKKKNWKSVKHFFGLSGGGYFKSHLFGTFADGGYVRNGNQSHWGNVPMYANGTSNALHGSMFIAGESGAEMVGHINGQTEVLNQSQIKLAMRSAVISGMLQFTGYWSQMNNLLVACTNSVINAILVSAEAINRSQTPTPIYELSENVANSMFAESQRLTAQSRADSTSQQELADLFREYIEPTLREIAADTKRQADKSERTVVQIGGRTVSDVVETQKNANGFVFAR